MIPVISHDYTRVQTGLQKLFDSGNYDEIVTLGKKLYTKGMEQVEQSHDEVKPHKKYAMHCQLSLKRCSLADVDKLEQAIDWEMADEYSLTGSLQIFWEKQFHKSDWSTIADRLLPRLQNSIPGNDKSEFSRDYNRDKLTNQIINALEHAGRSEEILDLCIREAPVTKSYERLVTILRRSGKTVEAEEWIRKGIKATQDNLPGIASGLRRQLYEIYMEKQDWPYCAAMRADDFFQSPSLTSYKDLQQACEKAKQWKLVRPAVMSFLTKGILPKPCSGQWPLPKTGNTIQRLNEYSKPPFTTILIEIAVFEKDIDEALRLYDESIKRSKTDSSWGYSWGSSISDQIADAVKDTYPDRSIGIWKRAAENYIARTNPNAYSIAIGYLNRISKVMIKTGQEKEFRNYIAEIRATNKRKIRLVEMLNGLTGKRIVDE